MTSPSTPSTPSPPPASPGAGRGRRSRAAASISVSPSTRHLATSLPTGTMTFSAVGALPVGRVDTHHLLVLAEDVTADEVEALAPAPNSRGPGTWMANCAPCWACPAGPRRS